MAKSRAAATAAAEGGPPPAATPTVSTCGHSADEAASVAELSSPAYRVHGATWWRPAPSAAPVPLAPALVDFVTASVSAAGPAAPPMWRCCDAGTSTWAAPEACAPWGDDGAARSNRKRAAPADGAARASPTGLGSKDAWSPAPPPSKRAPPAAPVLAVSPACRLLNNGADALCPPSLSRPAAAPPRPPPFMAPYAPPSPRASISDFLARLEASHRADAPRAGDGDGAGLGSASPRPLVALW
ncbi:hypothetical protein Rsub_03890 [Raphidocelis subcapitata]|uniref:Uncharacterized protein n=1 Tax=Raphidocelis subcapitata TaxID=307507 RepID=A0A2V0P1S3_9CHLO|nr:hypothetical protein Rsub_03890 [Raphidocelis subcapitata]|eukprot:GBF91035.1 hypothetical protein Rsub_03890 [Raphidocelis subcapitata]